MTPEPKKRLGEILAAKGYVTEAQVAHLVARSSASGRRIGEILIAEGFINDEILRASLEEQKKLG